jgi:signal transduction histidine kinase/CheY-like chemotaxis protein
MVDQMIPQSELKTIEAELVKAYFKDAGILNFAGSMVFLLMVFAVHDATPVWTWAPEVALLILVSVYRAYHIRQYRRSPESRDSRQWVNGQMFCGGVAGICWGASSAGMLANLPMPLQMFVLTVTTVVAAAATFESFFLVLPPRAFLLASITPQALWLLSAGGTLYISLSIMLVAFMVVAILLGNRKSRIFTEAQHLRFQNEFMANELARQHNLLERANRSKSKFLAAASHDLRQPVAALMIFLEQLELEQQLSSKGKVVLEHSQQATTALCGLLDSLLDISRLEGQSIRPNIRPIPIQRLFRAMADEFITLAAQKRIQLTFSPCSSVVESDEILLSQILRNLISNAIRYTSAGRILVGCRHRNGMLSIEVHDTGIGIAEDQRSRIFEEFYQVDNPERDRQRGLGLGLSIVDRAARLLGHKVTVSSQLGKGSSFAITLPLSETRDVDHPSVQDQSNLQLELTGRLIAVIENEGSIRTGMQNLLQSWGCKVVVADSAATMIEQLDSLGEEIEMVISDFGLRGPTNGIGAIAALRQRYGAQLPGLLFTGDISKETHTLATEAGLQILYKPANAEAIRKGITAAFGSQQ